MIVCVVDKINGSFVAKYPSRTLRRVKPYHDEEKFYIFELDENKYAEGYYWDNGLMYDESYLPLAQRPEGLVKKSIINAINFGNELMIDFISENVLMGITQQGKTEVVSDFLKDLTRHIQTGSLYAAINEVDKLVLNGIPVELEPFITEERLIQFKTRIQGYLN